MATTADTLPQNIHAERGLVGCMLETATPSEDFDPLWIVDAGRRALMLALDALRAEGLLSVPADYANAQDSYRCALTNGTLVVDLVERLNTWPRVDDPRVELAWCLDVGTQPMLIDVYERQLRETHAARGARCHTA